MNTTELIAALAKKTGASKTKAKETLKALFEIIEDALAAGDDVSLKGFGRFYIVSISSGYYRNPKTGESIRTKDKKKVRFKAGSHLQGKVS